MEKILVIIFVLFLIGKATGQKFSSKAFIGIVVVGLLLAISGFAAIVSVADDAGFFGLLSSGDGIITLVVVILLILVGVRLITGGTKGYARFRWFEWIVDYIHDTWNSRNDRW